MEERNFAPADLFVHQAIGVREPVDGSRPTPSPNSLVRSGGSAPKGSLSEVEISIMAAIN